ncbi:MAG: toxin-antitoxin system YwqK family antitoxin, partial [Myxococcales bacterium]|nr:toxin-antitoxin system YwqK family antitoxin [Myxococcales bacterium]
QPAPRVVTAPAPIDATAIDAPAAPKLACEPGAMIVPGPAPEPTLYCTRIDGVRDGAFVVMFPDATIEIKGAYKDGKLDGPWQRHYPSGQIAEEGSWKLGLKDGHWRQTGPTGTLLGEYDITAGTGTERRWFDEGPLYSERAIKSGVPNGVLKIYDPDGNVVVSAKLSAGKYDGPRTVGSRQTLRIEETFVHGVRRGTRQIWQFTLLVFEEAYDLRGKLDGQYTLWRDRKIPRVQGVYDHGKRIGTWTWFDRGNNKEREGDFVDGKKTGAWFEWNENKLVFSGTYTDGKPDGEFVYFDRNGTELGRFEIHDGTGTMMTFYPNHKPATKTKMYQGEIEGPYEELTMRGKTTLLGRYSSGRKHGRWHEQTETEVPLVDEYWKRGKLDGVFRKYVDGKVAVETTYKDGKVAGTYTEYREGKPWLTGQFDNDQRSGTWTQYDAAGSVVLSATYKAGVLDGSWRQLVGGVVVEGTMAAGRRTGIWTRTDRTGAVQSTTYLAP